MFHHVTPDWASVAVAVDKTVFMQDPNGVILFRLTAETAARHLTGADFNIKSIQRMGDDFYFGDKFGPHLILTDAAGVITSFWETQLNGNLIQPRQHNNIKLSRFIRYCLNRWTDDDIDLRWAVCRSSLCGGASLTHGFDVGRGLKLFTVNDGLAPPDPN